LTVGVTALGAKHDAGMQTHVISHPYLHPQCANGLLGPRLQFLREREQLIVRERGVLRHGV
jgi:hypothetical protein